MDKGDESSSFPLPSESGMPRSFAGSCISGGLVCLFCSIVYDLLFVVIPLLPFKSLQQLELEVKPLALPFSTSKN